MSGKWVTILVVAGVLSMLLVSGCGQSADLSLKFSPDRTTNYKSTTEVTKLFRFDQPNLGKLKEEQTKSLTEMDFTQTIKSIDSGGNATALITVNDFKVEIITKNETQFAFDSKNETDKDNPIAKFLGQSYTIEISPNGQVELLDAKDAIDAIKSDYEKNIVKGLLDTSAITKRHQVPGLPEDLTEILSVGDTWSKTEPSPRGVLAPKSYEKVYALKAIDGDIATIEMAATENAEGSSLSGGKMGIFAKMFDNKDEYTGSLKINVVNGNIIASDENFLSTYTAQEMPENGDPEKGPDVLTMQFINRVRLEKLD